MSYYGSLGAAESGSTATVLVQAYTASKYPGSSTAGSASTIGASKVGSQITKGPYAYPSEANSIISQINSKQISYTSGKGYSWSRARLGAIKHVTPLVPAGERTQYTRPPGTVVSDHRTGTVGVVGPDGHTIVDPTTGQTVGDTGGGFSLGLPLIIGGGLLLLFMLRRRA